MKSNHLLLVGVLLVFLGSFGDADGSLTYGDKCSVQNAILRVFTNADVDESEKCDGSKGLICTGTCTCPPTRVWDKGAFFGLFGGSQCIVGANGPCAQGDRCVANAVCGDNIPLCFCLEGYHAHELQCISSYGHNLSSGSTSVKFSWPASVISLLLIAKIITG